MSEAQALNEEEVLIDEEAVDVVEEVDAEAEVEIILEGEEQPASNGVPIGIQKRFKKLTTKVEEANTGKTEAEHKAEMLQAEIDLLRLEKGQTGKRPKLEDFETDEQFELAETQWFDERIDTRADKVAAGKLEALQKGGKAAQQDEHLKGKILSHYERAETLKMKNYEEIEDKAINSLGNDFAKQIMANSTQSHLILGHLGANPAKAEALKLLAQTDPLGAYTQALEIGGRLSIKSKTNAPDPETVVEGGIASPSKHPALAGVTYE